MDAPKKIPYQLLKAMQADSTSVPIPKAKREERKQKNPHLAALEKAVASTKESKKPSNKYKPQELSNDRPFLPKRIDDSQFVTKKPKARDPRFSDMSGTFNADLFAASYSFLDEKRNNETKNMQKIVSGQLKKQNGEKYSEQELEHYKQQLEKRKTQDIQRERLTKQMNMKRQLRKDEAQKIAETGKKPFYHATGQVRRKVHEERFHELDKKGKVDNIIAEKRKRQSRKDKTLLPKRRRVDGDDD